MSNWRRALASLANPGETIGSATARDELTHGVDASCEDLGECILKHFDKPVRAYRVGPAQSAPQASPGGATMEQPCSRTIAVIPFSARNDTPALFDVGNLIADSVIWRLSKAADLKVISRLSTAVFRGRANDVGEVSAHLGATYVLSGAYVAGCRPDHGDCRTLRSAQQPSGLDRPVERRNRRSAEAGKRTGGSYRPGSAFRPCSTPRSSIF